LQRVLVIEHEGEWFVVDDDQLQRFVCDVAIEGRHRGDRFANEPYRIVEGVPPLLRDLLDLIAVLLPTCDRSRAPHDLTVLVREDRLHARQGARLRDVDGLDLRMRMRTAKDAGVEHPG
jgi:hypothetical protein